MLSAIGSVLVVVGIITVIFGSIAFLLAAFRTSILWGLGTLFLGPVSIVYLVLHWDEAKKPFFVQLWGIGFIIVANLMILGNSPGAP